MDVLIQSDQSMIVQGITDFPTEESVLEFAYLGIQKASKIWTAQMQH
jgi:hypothetical protein